MSEPLKIEDRQNNSEQNELVEELIKLKNEFYNVAMKSMHEHGEMAKLQEKSAEEAELELMDKFEHDKAKFYKQLALKDSAVMHEINKLRDQNYPADDPNPREDIRNSLEFRLRVVLNKYFRDGCICPKDLNNLKLDFQSMLVYLETIMNDKQIVYNHGYILKQIFKIITGRSHNYERENAIIVPKINSTIPITAVGINNEDSK